MGFIRGTQPPTLSRDQAKAVILCRFVEEREIAQILREQNPFRSDCPGNPAGHYPIRSAGDIVCAHERCGKVFLR